jgi:hypothetical protein
MHFFSEEKKCTPTRAGFTRKSVVTSSRYCFKNNRNIKWHEKHLLCVLNERQNFSRVSSDAASNAVVNRATCATSICVVFASAKWHTKDIYQA